MGDKTLELGTLVIQQSSEDVLRRQAGARCPALRRLELCGFAIARVMQTG